MKSRRHISKAVENQCWGQIASIIGCFRLLGVKPGKLAKLEAELWKLLPRYLPKNQKETSLEELSAQFGKYFDKVDPEEVIW